ncbi:MAG: type II secretion system protein [Dehalococcoidia bacterium]|nr:type II secretion system protein [Dehalococcoidia bacterium]
MDQRGSSLLESVLAVALLGIVAVVLLAGLSSGSLATREAQSSVGAEQMALSQVEYMKGLPYQAPPASYATVTPSPDYTLTASAVSAESDNNVSLVTITVSLNGQPYVTLQTYKTNR